MNVFKKKKRCQASFLLFQSLGKAILVVPYLSHALSMVCWDGLNLKESISGEEKPLPRGQTPLPLGPAPPTRRAECQAPGPPGPQSAVPGLRSNAVSHSADSPSMPSSPLSSVPFNHSPIESLRGGGVMRHGREAASLSPYEPDSTSRLLLSGAQEVPGL